MRLVRSYGEKTMKLLYKLFIALSCSTTMVYFIKQLWLHGFNWHFAVAVFACLFCGIVHMTDVMEIINIKLDRLTKKLEKVAEKIEGLDK